MITTAEKQTLDGLIATRQVGHSLPGRFYRDELVFRADLEAIWQREWLFAGHSCEVARSGDYFTWQVGDDPLIITRDEQGELHALFNVCRHRGTLLCESPAGQQRRFICPYHQWTYAPDGSLVSCRGMHDVDRASLGLLRAQLRELSGLIFVSLAERPPPFTEAAERLLPMIAAQGLERARVARQIDYEVQANWKLVWENNRECYHCNVNHPQYIRANFDHYNEDDTTAAIRQQIGQAVQQHQTRAVESGVAITHRQSGMTLFPDPDAGLWYSANRTPLADGYVSESMDGRQVAPLMGDYTNPEVGTLRMRTVPNFWNHSSCDHSVSTRLLAAGPRRTLIRVTWLVDREAVEGRDYQLERLLPFWQLTSEQDWKLCERAQRGIESSRYRPGPYSRYKAYNVDRFVRWYLHRLSAGCTETRVPRS